jgi:hypothetical protein
MFIYSAWIGSVSIGLQFFLCILGSILISFFSSRVVGVLGGSIGTISLILCAFVIELKIYFLTYGVLFALGQALKLASTLSILPHYFNKV